MQDHKPPKYQGDELTTLRHLLQFQRESIVRKLEGLSDEQAKWTPVATRTSLIWLIKHLIVAERSWFVMSFSGGSPDLDNEGVMDSDTIASTVLVYREVWSLVDDILDGATADDKCRSTQFDPPLSLRWVLGHMLEETARHAGHADIIRELLDGQVGR